MIIFLKIFHFVVWLSVAASIFCILFAGIFSKLDYWLIIPYSIILCEGIILIANHWNCPLTEIAQKYSKSKQNHFYIHFPNWLAKHHRKILIIIFIIGTFFVIFNLLKRHTLI